MSDTFTVNACEWGGLENPLHKDDDVCGRVTEPMYMIATPFDNRSLQGDGPVCAMHIGEYIAWVALETVSGPDEDFPQSITLTRMTVDPDVITTVHNGDRFVDL